MKRFFSFLMITSLLWSCDSSTSSSATVDLKADIKKSETQLIITNNDYFDWKGVTIEINDKYEFKTDIIAAGHEVKIGFLNFIDSEYNKFNPFTLKVGEVMIHCTTSTKKDGYLFATFQ